MSKVVPQEILLLSDDQLRQESIKRGLQAGPITKTTRKYYENRLATVWGGVSATKSTPTKAATPRRSPKKQSLAAMSSEEEEEEESPKPTQRTPRNATPPKRKSVLPPTPVVTPATVSSSTPGKKKSVSRVTKKLASPPSLPVSYDTGSDSDGAPEQTQEKRSTTTYWRQSFGGPSTSMSAPPPGSSPFMSEYGRQLSLGNSFNGHSRSEAVKKMQPIRPECIDHSWTHKFFIKLLPILLALFFVYLAYCYMGMQGNPKDVVPKVEPFLQNVEQDPDSQFPTCKDTQMPGINCVLSSDVRPALESLRILAPTIKQRYIDAVCTAKRDPDGAGPSGAVNFDDLEKILEARGISDPESVINNIRVLLRHNPKWGLEIVNGGKAVLITSVSLPPLCFLKLKLASFLNVFIIVSALAAGVCAVVWIYKSLMTKISRDEAIKKALINRIQDRMEATEETPGPFSLPIEKLKEELLGPNNINKMQKAWDTALSTVLKFDSKIRMETKIVGGEEVDCLVWVASKSPRQQDKAAGGNAKMTFASTDQDDDASSLNSKDHPGMWQGQAFENVEGSFNSPPVSPTQCLKIRQMFVPDRPNGSEGVIDAILEKCGQNVNILHIKLDKGANETCVYMKTASQADAGRAFRALHGWWFDGHLVTVKFLRLERYHARFPESMQACIPLRSSSSNM